MGLSALAGGLAGANDVNNSGRVTSACAEGYPSADAPWIDKTMKPCQNSVHSSGSHTRALAVGLAIVTVLWQGSASGHQMDGRVFVFCVEKDGSNLERVSGELTGSASGPTWAPDGKRILYELFDGKTSEFRVVSRDGSKTLKVQLPSQVTNPGGASWSPADGAQIVFSALTIKPDGTTSHSFDIYTMELGAAQETTRRIVRDGFSPVWSPDGRRIAFVTARDGNFEVYTADTNGLHEPISKSQNLILSSD